MDINANTCIATAKEFAMPAYGRTFGTSASVDARMDLPVRGGHLIAPTGTTLGTPVWRPPDC